MDRAAWHYVRSGWHQCLRASPGAGGSDGTLRRILPPWRAGVLLGAGVKRRCRASRDKVVRLPRRRPRSRPRKAWAKVQRIWASWVAVRRRRRGRASLGVRLGRIALFGFVGLLVLVRVADLGVGYTKPAFGCRVTGVIDGDTVRLVCSGQWAVRGRLLGFDAPEVYSPRCLKEYARGVAATQRLRWEIWKARDVKTIGFREDRYGRRLVTLFLDGTNASDIMVQSGVARRYSGAIGQGWCR